MSTSNPAPEPIEIAGRFQVLAKLGAGAFGTVYKARDKVLGRLLAIKTIRMEGLAASQAGLAEMVERFRREAQVASQLKHPGIVTIYDIGQSEGMSYISMELIDGVGLDRVIAESGRIPVERAAALAVQVADALDFAHHAGVVHRDIKPANIMIEAGDRVKVTDFGIAKPTDSAEHLTLTGSLLGTPSYMSPEQARGSVLDGRSDLFSLGCVLYEMVAGRKAFRGDSITALLFKIITEEPQPIRELDPSLPDHLVEVIARAISKAPETRYQTGRELADDLVTLARPGSLPTLRARDAQTLPLVPAGAPTAVSPATDRASRPPTVTSAPTLPRVPAPPPLAATILTPAAPPARPATARATPASPRPSAPPAKRGGGGVALVLGLGLVALLVLGVLGVGAWVFTRRLHAPTTTASASPAPVAAVPSEAPVTTENAPSATIEATPPAAPAAPVPAATPPALAPARADAGRRGASREPAATDSTSAAPTEPGEHAGSSFLDEVPAETTDGRAAGDALAQKYRSGGSGNYSNRRFARRSRFPAQVGLPERPAVGTLAHVLNAEEAYQRANGSYGTLQDLQRAGFLHLDVPFANGAFQRARYRFQVTVAGDTFKATATPLRPGPRPFVVDDSGYIRADE